MWRHEWLKGKAGPRLACHLREQKDGVDLEQCYVRTQESPVLLTITSEVRDPSGAVVNRGKRFFDKHDSY